MQPKLIKTSVAEYVPAKWSGRNDSGFEPIGDRVLVLPDVASSRSSGGVELPQELTERMSMSAENGVVVAVGSGAFLWDPNSVTEFRGVKPVPGDRVYIERYAGQLVSGLDGQRYRLMNSSSIGAIQTASHH